MFVQIMIGGHLLHGATVCCLVGLEHLLAGQGAALEAIGKSASTVAIEIIELRHAETPMMHIRWTATTATVDVSRIGISCGEI